MTTKSTKPTVKKTEEVVKEEQILEEESPVEQTQPTEMDILKAQIAELMSLLGNTPQKEEEVITNRVQPND